MTLCNSLTVWFSEFGISSVTLSDFYTKFNVISKHNFDYHFLIPSLLLTIWLRDKKVVPKVYVSFLNILKYLD